MRFKNVYSTGWMIAAVIIFGGIAYSVIDSLDRPASIPWMTDFAAAEARAKREHKPLLIDFWATWCTWCYKMDRETYTDPKVATLASQCICVKIDADKDKPIARRYGVTALPYTVVQTESKPPIYNDGYLPPDEFRVWLETALDRVH